MIRDFCDITKKRLVEEINELRRRVSAGQAPAGVQADSVEAIDHVRGIGNIGADMEADINVIIDVDPDEAQVLIGLVELLFAEWYVAREQRKQGLEKLRTIAARRRSNKGIPVPNANARCCSASTRLHRRRVAGQAATSWIGAPPVRPTDRARPRSPAAHRA